MKTVSTVIRAEQDVSLTRVETHGSCGGILATRWLLRSPRLSEGETYHMAHKAEAAYRLERKDSSGASSPARRP